MTNSYAEFATVDPYEGMTTQSPGHVQNLVGGKWISESGIRDDIVDPLNGGRFLDVPDTTNTTPFLDGLAACPKTGLHNPMKKRGSLRPSRSRLCQSGRAACYAGR